MDTGPVKGVVKYAADLGYYVADACLPLHTTYNYNGQHTNQDRIHSLWESKTPELVNNYDYYIGKAVYLDRPLRFSWSLIRESFELRHNINFIKKIFPKHILKIIYTCLY